MDRTGSPCLVVGDALVLVTQNHMPGPMKHSIPVRFPTYFARSVLF